MDETVILESGDARVLTSDAGDLHIILGDDSYRLELSKDGNLELFHNGVSLGTTVAPDIYQEVENAELSDDDRERLEKLKEYVQEWGATVHIVLEMIRIIGGA